MILATVNTIVNYDLQTFIEQAAGVNLITLFGVNLLTLFCKLDLSKAMLQKLLFIMKWPSLQKSVRKFTPK
jgi:hypothetical protein